MDYFIEDEATIIAKMQMKKNNLMDAKYTSRLTEAQRKFAITRSKKLNVERKTSAPIIFASFLKSIHNDLTVSTFSNHKVIKINNENKIDYLWVTDYLENQKLTFEFCANDTWFIRTLICKPIKNEQAIKIIFKETVLAPKIIFGMTDSIEKKRYIKMQLIIFDYQIWQIKKIFCLLKKHQLLKYDKITL